MKYVFEKDTNSDFFKNIKVGECFSLEDNSTFPQTTVFMKLPRVKELDGDGACEPMNAINLVNNKLYYILCGESVIIRDATLHIDN